MTTANAAGRCAFVAGGHADLRRATLRDAVDQIATGAVNSLQDARQRILEAAGLTLTTGTAVATATANSTATTAVAVFDLMNGRARMDIAAVDIRSLHVRLRDRVSGRDVGTVCGRVNVVTELWPVAIALHRMMLS